MNNAVSYTPLEPSSLTDVGVKAPTFAVGSTPSFFATSSFLYALCFVAIVVGAFYRYVFAGVLRVQADEAGIRQSNEIIKKVTLGLLGVFSLFIILFTVNKGLVTGEVGLGDLKVSGSSSGGGVARVIPVTTTQGGTVSNTSSRSCESKDAVISRIQSGDACGGVSCTALSGCNYQQYLPIIEQVTGGDNQLRKMAIVTMCRESKANANAQNKNSDGTYDCGLMQINSRTPCDASIMSPSTNIQAGVQTLKTAINIGSQVYPGFPVEGNVFANYNCCSNGTKPSAPSADCTPASGFPSSIPKWGCPINPGTSDYNMCSVKNYACDLVACLKQL